MNKIKPDLLYRRGGSYERLNEFKKAFFAKKRRKLIIWLKSAEIQYLKPADSTLRLYFKITKEEVQLAEKTLNQKLYNNPNTNNKGEYNRWYLFARYLKWAPSNNIKEINDRKRLMRNSNYGRGGFTAGTDAMGRDPDDPEYGMP